MKNFAKNPGHVIPVQVRRGLANIIGLSVMAAFLAAPLRPTPANADPAPAPVVAAADGGKVTICHKGHVTMTISRDALDNHLAHGDTLGPCVPTPVN